MSNYILQIKQLAKTFGDNEVLKDINVNVQKGEIISVIGSSGSGKSTMLRCINLLETATSGEILFEDNNILLARGFQNTLGNIYVYTVPSI